MLKIKKSIFTLKNNKKLKFSLYLSFVLFFISVIYFSIPKLLIFSVDSIKDNLKDNNNIEINNISKLEYKIFPTPRLSIVNSNFTIGDGIVEVSNSKLELILNISQILNLKKINYKKLSIKNGSLKLDFNNINLLLSRVSKGKKKLSFRKSNLVFFQKETPFFEIKDTDIDIIQIKGGKNKLIINGNFLNNKISVKIENKLKNRSNLILKIPELDLAISIFSKKNKLNIVNGFFNLEIFNNFFKFNFTKEDNIRLTNGFIRSSLFNSSIEGDVIFKPNFYTMLEFKPSNLNFKKLFPIIQKIFFSNKVDNLSLVKKINGIFIFKSKLEGKITINNGEVLFEEFNVGKKKSFYFNAKIFELGEKGKIKFNLSTSIKHKRNVRNIKIIGFLIPFNSSVTFEKIFLDGKELSVETTKKHTNEFKNKIIQGSLGNIFNEAKIKKYFNFFF